MEIKMNGSSNLEKAEELLKLSHNDQFDALGLSDIDIDEYVINAIKANLCITIRIKYESDQAMVILTMSSNVKVMNFPNCNEDAYINFCKNTLNIDMDEVEHCSRSLLINGVKTRVYATMPPYSTLPLITISTTKVPPKNLDKQTIPDATFDKIVHSNFIIVGASGSGKTYLMNYLLNNFITKNEQIGIIEEFMELIPPNDLCTCLTCPPPKSNEKSRLRVITEQSNLMRLDAIYVGEIKGAEAWPFLVNLASGTRGACTIHGDNAQDALSRFRALCQLEMPNTDAINDFIAKSIKYIIVMKNKKIDGIYQLTGVHQRNTFTMSQISF